MGFFITKNLIGILINLGLLRYRRSNLLNKYKIAFIF